MHVICMDGIIVWGPPNNLQLWKKLMSNSLLVTDLRVHGDFHIDVTNNNDDELWLWNEIWEFWF